MKVVSLAFQRPSDKQVFVLKPYTTFEGRTNYRKVAKAKTFTR